MRLVSLHVSGLITLTLSSSEFRTKMGEVMEVGTTAEEAAGAVTLDDLAAGVWAVAVEAANVATLNAPATTIQRAAGKQAETVTKTIFLKARP